MAFVPFLLSLIPAYFLGEAAADKVAVELTPVTSRAVDLQSDDRSIYATSHELSEQAHCTLRSVTGAAIQLDHSVSHLSTEQDGRTWYRVAALPDNVDTGTYLFRCRAGGSAVDPTSFAVSAAPRWGQFALLLLATFGVPVAAAVFGLLIVVAIVVLRRRAEREERSLSALQLE